MNDQKDALQVTGLKQRHSVFQQREPRPDELLMFSKSFRKNSNQHFSNCWSTTTLTSWSQHTWYSNLVKPHNTKKNHKPVLLVNGDTKVLKAKENETRSFSFTLHKNEQPQIRPLKTLMSKWATSIKQINRYWWEQDALTHRWWEHTLAQPSWRSVRQSLCSLGTGLWWGQVTLTPWATLSF